MTFQLPSGDNPERTVFEVVVGAWREALTERGVKRAFLILLVGFITIPFAPAWLLLVGLERIGVYRVEDNMAANANGEQSDARKR